MALDQSALDNLSFRIIRANEDMLIGLQQEDNCSRCSKCHGNGHTYRTCANKEYLSLEEYRRLEEAEKRETDRVQEQKEVIWRKKKLNIFPNPPQKSDVLYEKDMIQSKHLRPLNKVAVLNYESVDRISGLPDKLLCLIMAFLPTRCAVSTSLLSKRWKYVWIDIPILEFVDLPSSMIRSEIIFNQEQYASFKNFVNRTLLLNRVPCLERFSLEVYEGFSCTHVYDWMLVIASRCVQELCLISKHLRIKLPSNFLLAKEKLVVLKLEDSFILCLPSTVHFPSLENLSLVKVVFPNEHNPLTSLLSSCPVLKMLNIDCCEGLAKFSVCSSSVKTLRILSANEKKDVILIKTPNLEVLHLSIGITRPVVNDLSSLVEARLDIWTSRVRWIKFLQKLRFAKALVLCRIILNGSSANIQMPIFRNLTHLEAGSTAWLTVLQVLGNAPKLVSFIIHKSMFDWPDIEPPQNGLLLERIEYYDFDVEEGFKVVTYFLRNSPVLKEFKIYTHSSLDLMTENKILKTLVKLRRTSNQCEIIFVNRITKCESEANYREQEGLESDDSTSLDEE